MLALGDHLSAVEFPFASTTSDYRTTLASLVELLRNDPPAHVVPGHGPALTAEEALTIAEADLAYLRALRDAVAASPDDRERARAAAIAVRCPGQRLTTLPRCMRATWKRSSRSSCRDLHRCG